MTSLKKFALLCAIGFTLLSLQGCWVTSIYPYGQPSDIVRDDSLLGTWVVPGEGCTLTFTKYHEPLQMYVATYSAPRKSECMEAGVTSLDLTGRLYQVGNNRFLDIGPGRTDSVLVAPVHVLLKVVKGGKRLKLVPIYFGYMEDGITSGNLPLEARVGFDRWGTALHPDEQMVLVSKTAELRKFLLENGDNPEVFNATAEYMTVLTFEPKQTATRRMPKKPSK